MPTLVLNNCCSYQVLFGHTLDHNMFKFFGWLCYPLLKHYNNHKFNFKSFTCLFLGLCLNRKGYICMHPSGNFFFSRSILFNEQVFSINFLQICLRPKLLLFSTPHIYLHPISIHHPYLLLLHQKNVMCHPRCCTSRFYYHILFTRKLTSSV